MASVLSGTPGNPNLSTELLSFSPRAARVRVRNLQFFDGGNLPVVNLPVVKLVDLRVVKLTLLPRAVKNPKFIQVEYVMFCQMSKWNQGLSEDPSACVFPGFKGNLAKKTKRSD